MPPKRATRASSEEGAPHKTVEVTPKPTTRASRRLRSTQEPDASPLRALSPPRRKTRAVSTKVESSRKQITSTSPTVPHTNDEKDSFNKSNATTPGALEQAALQVAASTLSTAGRARLVELSIKSFLDPLEFSNVPSVSDFVLVANEHKAHQLDLVDIRIRLTGLIQNMTDNDKVDLLIAQRAKIISQAETVQQTKEALEREKEVADKERESRQRLLRQVSAKAQQEKEERATKEKAAALSASKKRPAPSDEEDGNEEHPARRMKISEGSTVTSIARPSPSSSASPPQMTESSPAQTPAEAKSPAKSPVQSSPVISTAQSSPSQSPSPVPSPLPTTTTPSKWGFSGIFGGISRIFRAGAPQTAPVQRTQQLITAPQSPEASPIQSAVQRRVSNEAPRRDSSPSSDADDEDNQVAETPKHNIGITSQNFIPQTAPQPRRAATQTPGPIPRRKTFREKLAAHDATAARRKAEAERLEQEKIEREDERLRAEAQMLRRKALEATQVTGQKRKDRVDKLDVIPNIKPGSFGMDLKYFEVDSDDEDDTVSIKKDITPPPAKRVRFSEDSTPAHKSTSASTYRPSTPAWKSMGAGLTTVSPYIKTPEASATADPHRARPYTGTMFADTKPGESFSGSNLFGQSQNREAKKAEQTTREVLKVSQSTTTHRRAPSQEERANPVAYGRQYGVWIGPKMPKSTNPGTFQVPDDTDSESDFSDSEEADNSVQVAPKTPERVDTSSSSERVNVFFQKASAEKAQSDDAAAAEQELQAPPSPTMSHATLPGKTVPSTKEASGSFALTKARNDAEKYKPKTPSGLRATSKLASSPATGNDMTPTKTKIGIPAPAGAMAPSPFAGWAALQGMNDEQAAQFAKYSQVADSVRMDLAQPETKITKNNVGVSDQALAAAALEESESIPTKTFNWPTIAKVIMDPEVEAHYNKAINGPMYQQMYNKYSEAFAPACATIMASAQHSN